MRRLVGLLMGLSVVACSWHDPLGPVAPTTTSTGSRPTGGGGPFHPDTTAIAIGDRVEGTVKPDDPHCWPDWDSTAVCRVYSVLATEDGTLTATLSFSGSGEPMDVFLFLGQHGGPIWDASSKPKASVTAGQTVAIGVMSYQPPQDFVLETAFQP